MPSEVKEATNLDNWITCLMNFCDGMLFSGFHLVQDELSSQCMCLSLSSVVLFSLCLLSTGRSRSGMGQAAIASSLLGKFFFAFWDITDPYPFLKGHGGHRSRIPELWCL
ncbi:hypothetical protein VNO77_33525 [Canavalia gladiata]|uniref:Uncharacterized protein n=1 Tax=Canavalia gladiata TaxID=3824 RepID=A0AAN9KE23_CANGL